MGYGGVECCSDFGKLKGFAGEEGSYDSLYWVMGRGKVVWMLGGRDAMLMRTLEAEGCSGYDKHRWVYTLIDRGDDVFDRHRGAKAIWFIKARNEI